MNHIAQQTSVVLIDATLKSVVIFLLAVGLLWLLKVKRSRSFVHDAHRVWMVVVIAVVSLPVLTLVVPRLNVPLAINWIPVESQIDVSPLVLNPKNDVVSEDEFRASPDTPVGTAIRSGSDNAVGMIPTDYSPVEKFAIQDSQSIIPAIEIEPELIVFHDDTESESRSSYFVVMSGLIVWLIGLTFFAAKLLIAVLRTQQVVSAATAIELSDSQIGPAIAAEFELPNNTLVLQSDEIASPVVAGCFSFRILLPTQWAQWTTGKLAAVLAHESAHIRRRDGLVSLLSEIATVVFWFNPIPWIAKIQLSRFAELSCDQAAALSTGNRFDYATQLLEIAAARRGHDVGFQPGIAMASKSEISRRIELLLDTTRPLRNRASKIFWTFMVLVGLPALLLVAAAQPGSAKQDSDSVASEINLDDKNHTRMDGDKLFMRFRGEVFMPDGSPAKDFKLDVEFSGMAHRKITDIKTDGNRFEFEVEINRQGYISGLYISATSADGKLMVDQRGYGYGLRSLSTKLIQLKLGATKTKLVRVLFEGNPVSGATVSYKTDSFAYHSLCKANDKGVCELTLPVASELESLNAWIDDPMFGRKIGGYGFNDDVPRDPSPQEHVIEMIKCRDQSIVVIDEKSKPVPGLTFESRVESLPGKISVPKRGMEKLVTDENGMVVDPWFPDWKEPRFRIKLDRPVRMYGFIRAGNAELKDGLYQVMLKKTFDGSRKTVTGKVKLPDDCQGGLRIDLATHQHPQEGRYDPLHCTCDDEGNFSVDVIPGATYVAQIEDEDWVSNEPWIGVLYDPDSGEMTSPELEVSTGQEVEVVLTAGPNRQPLRNMSVELSSRVDVEWVKDGEKRSGSLGRGWWVATNEFGVAKSRAGTGELRVRVSTPEWKTSKTTNVKLGESLKIDFHRKSPGKRMVKGRVRLPAGSNTELAGTEIQLFAMDRQTVSQAKTHADKDGWFSAELDGSRIAIFAKTSDGSFAKSEVFDDPDKGIQLDMAASGVFRGQLVGENDLPFANKTVRMTALLKEKDRYSTQEVRSQFDVDTIETVTDAAGKFEFKGVPQLTTMHLKAVVPEVNAMKEPNRRSSDDSVNLGYRYFRPNENRPLEKIRMGSRSKSTKPSQTIEEILGWRVNDCRLLGMHLLVAIPGEGDAEEFAAKVIKDDDTHKSLLRYFPTLINQEQSTFADRAKSFKQRNWSVPPGNKTLFVVLDGNGNQIADLVVDGDKPEALAKAVLFFDAYAPKQVDGRKKYDEALKLAKSTNRKIWLQFSQTRCGPCYTLSRWLDKQRAVIERDYVVLKIDTLNDKKGNEIWKDYVTRDEVVGIPFTLILDADGKELASSIGHDGNVGHPSSFEGKQQFREMIEATATKLGQQEIDELIDSL